MAIKLPEVAIACSPRYQSGAVMWQVVPADPTDPADSGDALTIVAVAQTADSSHSEFPSHLTSS